MAERIVIVGAGQAASQCVLSLRTEGWQDEIMLIGEEDALPYHRPPLSKGYLSGEVTLEKLPIRPAEYYEKQNVDIHLNTRIVKIEREQKQLITQDGEIIAYNKLCLSTGVRVKKLQGVEGLDSDNTKGVFYLRTLNDVNNITAHLQENSKSVVIIGGGYIGLEIAASMVKKGYKVTIVEAGERILGRVTSPVISQFFTDLHRENGVDILTGVSIKRFICNNNNVSAVELADGNIIESDTVLVGIGIEVNDELARQAKLDIEHGVVVNEYCQTSETNIFAIGDCTWHRNPLYNKWLRLESIQNANDQAKIAAKAMIGKEPLLEYRSLPWFWSDQYDVKLQIAGLSSDYDEYQVDGEITEKDFSVSYYKQGKLIAVDAINRPRHFMQAKKQILQEFS